jgi:hypothetical protein
MFMQEAMPQKKWWGYPLEMLPGGTRASFLPKFRRVNPGKPDA